MCPAQTRARARLRTLPRFSCIGGYLSLLVLGSKVLPASSTCFPCNACKKEGLLNRTAQFVTDPASCASDVPVVDLRGFATVADLTCCPVSIHWAYFHKLVDCLVPSLMTLHKAMRTRDAAMVAIIPSHLSDFYDVIIPKSASIGRRLHEPKSAACYIVASEKAVVNKEAESMALPDLWSAIRASGSWAVLHGALSSLPEAGGPARKTAPYPHRAGTITLLRRHGRSRAFANAEGILTALHEEFPSWHVQLFHGNETVAQTMAMFARSKVVIGYHGAGFANTLFCPPGTVVLEFTTMRGVDSRALWRSNALLERIHPNLTWIQHAVDLDRLDNGPAAAGTFLNDLRAKSDREVLIKGIKHIHISSGVLFNAISRLKKEMAALGM